MDSSETGGFYGSFYYPFWWWIFPRWIGLYPGVHHPAEKS
jgi:hypothetical protein